MRLWFTKTFAHLKTIRTFSNFYRGDTHNDVHFEGDGGKAKMRCYRRLGRGGVGLESVLDVESFFLLEKIGFAPRSDIILNQNIDILLTRNLPFDYRCIVCELNRTIERGVNVNVTWLDLFSCFVFVRLHARCSCCFIVCLRFHVVQIKQVDCKMSTNDVNDYK